jgi:phosphoserine phosphatase
MEPELSQKQIKLVCFDMDGVLFDVEGYNESGKKVAISTWNVVFDSIGIYHEHERLKEMFIKGYFSSYMEWTNEACKVLQKHGLTRAKFMEIINNRPLMKGAEEALKELKKRGYKTAVITGSFEALARRAKNLLDLDYTISHCKLIFDEYGNLKKWQLIDCDFEGKLRHLEKLAKRLNLDLPECAYIGDEINDIPIFRKVGLSIAFNCHKEEVKKAVNVTIDRKDLREVLRYFPPITN